VVVLQNQSFRPLPATITVNGQSVPTRGDFAGFESGVTGLIMPSMLQLALPASRAL